MQVKHVGFGIRGFYRAAKMGQNLGMKGEAAEKRLEILKFWRKHGLEATKDAYQVSRRTLYRWEQRLKASGGKLETLVPKSTRPKRFRKSQWPFELALEIRRLRHKHPNVGKEKLTKLLVPWCQKHGLPVPSASTIGRIIARAPDKMRVSPPRLSARGKPKRRRERSKVRVRGKRKTKPNVWALDVIIVVSGGLRRCVVCLVHEGSRLALACATASLSSRKTAQFLKAFLQTFFPPSADTPQPPSPLPCFVTDNGSGFVGEFAKALQSFALEHLWTYPRPPKENPFVERFNRTLQEMFINFHLDLLFTELDLFNRKLANFLILYNTQLPHHALKLKTPIQAFAESLNACQRIWTNTGGLTTGGDVWFICQP